MIELKYLLFFIINIVFIIIALLIISIVIIALFKIVYYLLFDDKNLTKNEILEILNLKISKENFKCKKREKVFIDTILYYYRIGKIKTKKQLEKYMEKELEQTEWLDYEEI